MRAKSPQDRLGGPNALPVPLISIGTMVRPEPLSSYERKRILQSILRTMIRVLVDLRRDGYIKREPGSKLIREHNKGQIRAAMRVIDTANEVQIVSVVCVGHHLGNHVVNQCYIGGDHATSGADFYGQLLFRAIDDEGRHVCVLQPHDTIPYTFSQHALVERVITLEVTS